MFIYCSARKFVRISDFSPTKWATSADAADVPRWSTTVSFSAWLSAMILGLEDPKMEEEMPPPPSTVTSTRSACSVVCVRAHWQMQTRATQGKTRYSARQTMTGQLSQVREAEKSRVTTSFMNFATKLRLSRNLQTRDGFHLTITYTFEVRTLFNF